MGDKDTPRRGRTGQQPGAPSYQSGQGHGRTLHGQHPWSLPLLLVLSRWQAQDKGVAYLMCAHQWGPAQGLIAPAPIWPQVPSCPVT